MELVGLLDEDVIDIDVDEEEVETTVDVVLLVVREVHERLVDDVYELLDEELSHSEVVHVLGQVHGFECHSLEVEITLPGLSSS